MKVLLDTHALLWWTYEPAKLSIPALEAIADGANQVFVSPVSAMEIATKYRKGGVEHAAALARDFTAQIAVDGFVDLPIIADHAALAGGFDDPHADPWDRLLAAQARIEGLSLVTCDPKMIGFGVATFW